MAENELGFIDSTNCSVFAVVLFFISHILKIKIVQFGIAKELVKWQKLHLLYLLIYFIVDLIFRMKWPIFS